MSVVEVRPDVPDLAGVLMIPDPRPGIARCRLIVDHDAGTAVWLSDGRAQERFGLIALVVVLTGWSA